MLSTSKVSMSAAMKANREERYEVNVLAKIRSREAGKTIDGMASSTVRLEPIREIMRKAIRALRIVSTVLSRASLASNSSAMSGLDTVARPIVRDERKSGTARRNAVQPSVSTTRGIDR